MRYNRWVDLVEQQVTFYRQGMESEVVGWTSLERFDFPGMKTYTNGSLYVGCLDGYLPSRIVGFGDWHPC